MGAGPVFLFPTGSHNRLTADKWGAGPTAIALKQHGPWTYGGLVNHLWSFAGKDARPDVKATFMQPFVTYTNTDAMSITGSTEATYDWESEQWAVPVIATVTKVTHMGDQAVSFGGSVRYWAESTDGGPEGLAGRLVFTFLFPQ